MKHKVITRQRRHKKVRAKIFGTTTRPRLCVFRSNQYIYAQLVDDEKHKTILAVNDAKFKKDKKTKVERAQEVGRLIGEGAKELKVKEVVFDRGGYKYFGRVKAVAEGARATGLKF